MRCCVAVVNTTPDRCRQRSLGSSVQNQNGCNHYDSSKRCYDGIAAMSLTAIFFIFINERRPKNEYTIVRLWAAFGMTEAHHLVSDHFLVYSSSSPIETASHSLRRPSIRLQKPGNYGI